jgi:UDP-N-acetylmuramate dehydrogenase
MMNDLGGRLASLCGETNVRPDAPLAPLTTFRVGGPADWLIEVHHGEVLAQVIAIARESGTPLTVLGGGSNVLVSDSGVRGIVVRFRGGDVSSIGPSLVRADAGVTINGLVRWTVNRGLAGIEAWAGTPGTVGGAVYGNAHFKGRSIDELIESVRLIRRDGVVQNIPHREMDFAYDYSRLHRTQEIVVSADFRVSTGDPSVLRVTARDSLAFRKRTQPLESPSAGCIFQNPDSSRDRVPDGIPASAGALVDRAGLKGAREGAARVSTTHANFIINEGGATARDIRLLIDRCKSEVRARFGVSLREEIMYLGEGH